MDRISKTIDTADALMLRHKFQEAAVLLNQALKVDPDNTDIIDRLKHVKQLMSDDQDVIDFYYKVLEITPNCGVSLNHLALRLFEMGRANEALKHAQKLVEIYPNDTVYINTLGLIYKDLELLSEAEDCFLKALALEPENAYVWTNLGTAYAHQLKLEQSIKASEKAVSIDQGINGAFVNLSFSHFMSGNHRTAWEYYEHRLTHFPQLMAYVGRLGIEKKWGGISSLEGKRIAIYCEQGFGDAIQMARHFKDVKNMGAYVIVQCAEELKPLFEIVEGVDEINIKNDVLHGNFSEFDYHVPCMSLPLLLNKTQGNGEPYIFANDPRPQDQVWRIGIAWKGSSSHPNDKRRSCEVKHFLGLTDLSNVKFISLQLEQFNYPNVEDSRGIKSFLDTAKLISTLDLVITVDTSILHLAGSMGKPTLGLLAYMPDFRWGIEKDTRWYNCPWYNSVKLIRQKERGNWDEVFVQVRRELEAHYG